MIFRKTIDLVDPEDSARLFQCNGIVFYNACFYIRTYAHIHCIELVNFKIIWSFRCNASINTYFPLFAKDNVLVYNGYEVKNSSSPQADAAYIAEFGSGQMPKTTVPIKGLCLETQKEIWSIYVGWGVNSHNAGFISDGNDLLITSIKDKTSFLNKVDIQTGKLIELGSMIFINRSGNDQDDKLSAILKSGYLYFANNTTGLNRIEINSPLTKEENLLACSPDRFVKIEDKIYFFSRGELGLSIIEKSQPRLYSIDTESDKMDDGLRIGEPIKPNCIALIDFKGRLLCMTGSESKGLFCYDAVTGLLLWKLGEGDWNVQCILNTPIGIVVKKLGGIEILLLNPITGETIQTEFLEQDQTAMSKIKYVNDTLFIPHSKGLGVYKY